MARLFCKAVEVKRIVVFPSCCLLGSGHIFTYIHFEILHMYNGTLKNSASQQQLKTTVNQPGCLVEEIKIAESSVLDFHVVAHNLQKIAKNKQGLAMC